MRKSAGISIVFLCCATAMAADFTGTWKLNPEKSKLRIPETLTITIEKTGPDSYRTSAKGTMSGKDFHFEVNRACDGREHAGAGESDKESEICTIGAGRSRKIVMKDSGKVVRTVTSTVSKDGQTMTNLRVDNNGQDVMVFDREK